MGRRVTGLATMVLLGLAGSGCSRARSDNQIATDIKARMYSDSQLKGTALTVAVDGGVATVSGQVPSVAARYEAFKLTAQTPGVSRVNDEMTVQEPEANPAIAASPSVQPPAPEPVTLTPRRSRIRTRRPARNAESAPEQQQPSSAEAAPPAEAQTAPEATPPSSAPAAPVPPPIQRIEIPAGTAVNIRMVDAIDSATSHPGEIFHSSLDTPLVVGSRVVAPRGTDVYVRLVQAQSAGRLSGQSELRVELYRMELNGKSYPLVSNDYDLKGTSRGKRSVATVLGGAAIGAAIGAIAGGGKGAAIGAGVGGGGGAVYQGTRHGKQVKIPSETLLNFQLAQPVEVTASQAGEQPPPSNPQ